MVTHKAIPLMGQQYLNFDIRSSLNQPLNPKENTIWVDTSVLSNKWSIDGKEPTSPIVGQIWFCVANSNGLVSFNALKTNQLDINLTAAYQWNGTEWEWRNAYIYIDNEWVHFSVIPITNAIESLNWVYGGTYHGEIVENKLSVDTDPNISNNVDVSTSMCITEEKIDVTGYSTMTVNMSDYKTGSANMYCYIGISDSPDLSSTELSIINLDEINTEIKESFIEYKRLLGQMTGSISQPYEYTIDLSNIKGKYYIKLVLLSAYVSGYVIIDSISLE